MLIFSNFVAIPKNQFTPCDKRFSDDADLATDGLGTVSLMLFQLPVPLNASSNSLANILFASSKALRPFDT